MARFKIDGGDFKGTINEQHGFWLYTKPCIGARDLADIQVGESTTYQYVDGQARGATYSVKRLADVDA